MDFTGMNSGAVKRRQQNMSKADNNTATTMASYDFNICSVDDVQKVSVYRVSAPLACDKDDTQQSNQLPDLRTWRSDDLVPVPLLCIGDDTALEVTH